MKHILHILPFVMVLAMSDAVGAMPIGLRMTLWNRTAREVRTYPVAEAAEADATSALLAWSVGTNGVASAEGCDDATSAWGKSVKFTASDDSSAWVETVVSNECRLSFSWKCSCEPLVKGNPYDYLSFAVDGGQPSFVCGETDWTKMTFDVAGLGEHRLRWTFRRDAWDSAGENSAWLAGFTWKPSEGGIAEIAVDVGGGKSVAVPNEWLAAHESIVREHGGDVAAAMRAMAANGRLSNVECYVLGLDPEKPDDDFRIVSFPMKADGTPDMENIVFEPATDKWNVRGARAVLKGAAELGGGWKAVDGATEAEKAKSQFFKVEVEMP